MYKQNITVTYPNLPDNKEVHIWIDKDIDVSIKINEGSYWIEVSGPNGWTPLGKYTPQQLVDFILPILFTGEYHEQD